jgi:hypothetical protein
LFFVCFYCDAGMFEIVVCVMRQWINTAGLEGQSSRLQ